MKIEHTLNEHIKLSNVLLFTLDGNKLGNFSLSEALCLADNENMDLMQVGQDGDVAVCKMVDYESWHYHEVKNKQKQAFKNRSQELKSINFKTTISDNDFNMKIKKINDFLNNQHKVKIAIKLYSRQSSMQDINHNFINKIMVDTKEFGIIDGELSFSGKDITFTLKPKKTTNEKKL